MKLIPPDPRQIVGSGYFKRGTPKLTFYVNGKKLYGIIDTGFTGFLVLPLQTAQDLKLRAVGIGHAMLADGYVSTNLVAEVPMTFAGRTRTGYASISPLSKMTLIGLDFLHRFHLGLVVTKKLVLLVDEDWIATARTQDIS